MNTQDIAKASSLLKQREALKKRIDGLDPYAVSGLIELSTTRPALPTDGNPYRGGNVDRSTQVPVSGDTLKVLTDLVGGLISRRMEEIDVELLNMGVTEAMTPQPDEATCAEPEQDPASIEVIVFGRVCDCPNCRGAS